MTSTASATQLLALAFFPFLAPPDEPAIQPLLFSFVRMLRCWLSPYVCPIAFAIGLWHSSALAMLLSALAFINMCCDWQVRRTLWHHGPVKPGLYAAPSARNRRLLAILERSGWTSDSTGLGRGAPIPLTPWLWNGDLHTIFPFLVYPTVSSGITYERIWFHAPAMGDGAGSGYSVRTGTAQRVAVDDSERPPECCALDWAFPEGGFNERRPVAVVLHGLNGGSAEPLVMDFVHHATERLGWTCVVMIARGLAGVGNTSGVPFNGARTSDLAAALDVIRGAVPGSTPLVGVGYSMGAIVLAHYVGVAGPEMSARVCDRHLGIAQCGGRHHSARPAAVATSACARAKAHAAPTAVLA